MKLSYLADFFFFLFSGSLWNYIRECYAVFLKQSQIFIISQICFNLYRAENGTGHGLAEEHPKNPKNCWGFQLDLEVSIFAKIFELYLVTQSHLANRSVMCLLT